MREDTLSYCQYGLQTRYKESDRKLKGRTQPKQKGVRGTN